MNRMGTFTSALALVAGAGLMTSTQAQAQTVSGLCGSTLTTDTKIKGDGVTVDVLNSCIINVDDGVDCH